MLTPSPCHLAIQEENNGPTCCYHQTFGSNPDGRAIRARPRAVPAGAPGAGVAVARRLSAGLLVCAEPLSGQSGECRAGSAVRRPGELSVRLPPAGFLVRSLAHVLLHDPLGWARTRARPTVRNRA